MATSRPLWQEAVRVCAEELRAEILRVDNAQLQVQLLAKLDHLSGWAFLLCATVCKLTPTYIPIKTTQKRRRMTTTGRGSTARARHPPPCTWYGCLCGEAVNDSICFVCLFFALFAL
jgi:hypothetical protein